MFLLTKCMDPIFKKLNYKEQAAIMVLNAPESFALNLEVMKEFTQIFTEQKGIEKIDFVLAFVTQKAEIETLSAAIFPILEGDALLWVAYPKKSSKNYATDISRDSGWQSLGNLGLEPVRMIAIDKDWSALRFRKVAFIKKLTRRSSMALSKEGKERTSNKN